MSEEDLSKLSPEERRKKLKEISEKKKQEIAEAQKMLQETESEIAQEAEWKRKVPIPQVAAGKMKGLSEAEKEIIGAHQGVSGRKAEKVSEEKKAPVKREESLEETLFKERIAVAPEVRGSDYAEHLSLRPMGELAQEMKSVYQATADKGYVSAADERKIEYLSAATELKLDDIERGAYSLTEQVAEAAMLTKQMGGSLMDEYKRSSKQSGSGTYQR